MKYCILIIALTLFACSNNDDSKKVTSMRADLVQSPEKDSFPTTELLIDKGDEEGWGADIRLSIVDIKRTDSSVTYFANSIYEKRNVGLEITIPRDSLENGKKLLGLMTLTSSGIISDNLIATLSKLYKEKIESSLHFTPSRRVAFIDLTKFAKSRSGKEPSNKTTVKEMKIFFEQENPEDNAELYINVNEEEHWLEIKEKDEDYRKAVIKALTTK